MKAVCLNEICDFTASLESCEEELVAHPKWRESTDAKTLLYTKIHDHEIQNIGHRIVQVSVNVRDEPSFRRNRP